MSSTASSTAAAASASSSSCATQNFSDFPTKDIACAVGGTSGFNSSYRDTLKDCCKSAPVESWANNCGLYCLSVDQTIADLQKCWQEGGVKAGEIYCSGNNTATATGKPSSSGSATGSGSQASNTAGGQSNAPVHGVSKTGLSMAAMVLVSAVFGVLL
ncbi:hypothetical protein P280DRAFT_471630 [Massarina eburnea CBS 473.64]|uniref:Uncharacterized protein n=1 Tax=Massarina eburnea CBS 473.64 TaxID=1395130 RepID=A0A6A6RS91_9PLEO|nr:hypothetical protein P280DRAFT_471630 [Massarina eburnea CBS 473.64]